MTNEEAINVINVVRNIILKDPSWLKSFTDLVNEAVPYLYQRHWLTARSVRHDIA